MTLPRLTKSTNEPASVLKASLKLKAPHMECDVDRLTNGEYTALFYDITGGPYHTLQATEADCYAAVLEAIK